MIIIEQLKKVKDTRSHINQVYPVMEVACLVITAALLRNSMELNQEPTI